MSNLNAYLYEVTETHFTLNKNAYNVFYRVWVVASSPREARHYLSKNYVKHDENASVHFSSPLDWYNGNAFTKSHFKGELIYSDHYE